ncbi:MAG: hypothetical protein OHK0017_06700 [Patescibacteria group bacterium]
MKVESKKVLERAEVSWVYRDTAYNLKKYLRNDLGIVARVGEELDMLIGSGIITDQTTWSAQARTEMIGQVIDSRLRKFQAVFFNQFLRYVSQGITDIATIISYIRENPAIRKFKHNSEFIDTLLSPKYFNLLIHAIFVGRGGINFVYIGLLESVIAEINIAKLNTSELDEYKNDLMESLTSILMKSRDNKDFLKQLDKFAHDVSVQNNSQIVGFIIHAVSKIKESFNFESNLAESEMPDTLVKIINTQNQNSPSFNFVYPYKFTYGKDEYPFEIDVRQDILY